MQPPRLSPRRIFAASTLALFLWATIGGRLNADTPSPRASNSFMFAAQDVFGGILDTLLTPPKWIFSSIQGVANRTIARMNSNPSGESIETLRLERDQLRDQIDQRDAQIRQYEQLLLQYQALAPFGLTSHDLLSASITGAQTGPGAAIITLDKGSLDGVTRGMPVSAAITVSIPTAPVNPAEGPSKPATQVVPAATLLGMVDSVAPKTCTVRLMSDPHMKTEAVLVRRLPDRAALLTPDPCLVEGLGDNQLRCATIDVAKVLATPEIGDLVELADRNWPPATRFMLIGEVTAVSRKDTQILRYDLTITPRINLNSLQSVLIILKS
ncbi:MAG: rod shape-determining protein MreC [Phycisphaerae bacterium]